ncbi:MAG: GntR family transcriptional regulator [Kiloniellales bacterium]
MAVGDASAGLQAQAAARLSPVRSQSVVDLVLAQLEGLFVGNGFRPGERLNEVALSQAMSVSRSSLREAARKLEQRGWLVSRPNRGFFVRSFTEVEVTQIYEARLCLESFAVRKCLASLTAPQKASLEGSFRTLVKAATSASGQQIVDPILAFHRAIVALAENEILLRSFDELAMDTKLIVTLIGGVQANPDTFLDRNRAIYEALMAADIVSSLGALERYLTTGLGEVVAFLRQDGPEERASVPTPPLRA